MKRRDFVKGMLAAGTVAITNPATAQTQILTLKDFIRIRLCPKSTYVRRDIYSLMKSNPEHPTIKAFRDGVAAMKALPASNPTSWAYQANIHGTTLPFNQWPAGAPFATCEHGTQYFLSWHRMYLFFFEKIVRKHAGNNSFALPYWNYSKAGQAALPLPFRNPVGAGNSLYDGTRSNAVNSGTPLAANTVSDANALSKASFLGAAQFQSTLEGTPHGAVHVTIGGNMGNFAGAGRDPIFWLHHCNLDRVWEKWLSLGAGHANPIGDAAWMSETAEFVDENGNFVTMVNSDILETVAQLKYQYEDPRECVSLQLVNWRLVDIVSRVSVKPRMKYTLRTDWKIDLRQRAARLETLDIQQKDEVARLLQPERLAEVAKGNRVVLRFRELQLREPMNGYFEVYMSAGQREPVYLGNITTFGADAGSQQSMMQSPKMREKQGHEMGVSTDIDITDQLIEQLKGRTNEDNNLSVTLRPVSGTEQRGAVINPKAEPAFREVTLEVLPFEAN